MRVALVEPSRTIRRIVTETIAAWGHEVSAFVDAQEALNALATNKDIRALITTTEFPTSSGIQLVRDARKLAGTRLGADYPCYLDPLAGGSDSDFDFAPSLSP
jgi:DNA-binding response OmpR family regulator